MTDGAAKIRTIPPNSVEGFINTVTNQKFVGAFAIDGTCYCVIGDLGVNVPKFKSGKATLHYDDTKAITSTDAKDVAGNVGKAKLELWFGGVFVIKADYIADIAMGNDVTCGKATWVKD